MGGGVSLWRRCGFCLAQVEAEGRRGERGWEKWLPAESIAPEISGRLALRDTDGILSPSEPAEQSAVCCLTGRPWLD